MPSARRLLPLPWSSPRPVGWRTWPWRSQAAWAACLCPELCSSPVKLKRYSFSAPHLNKHLFFYLTKCCQTVSTYGQYTVAQVAIFGHAKQETAEHLRVPNINLHYIILIVKPICSKDWNWRHRKTKPIILTLTVVLIKLKKGHAMQQSMYKTTHLSLIDNSLQFSLWSRSPSTALSTFYISTSNTLLSNSFSDVWTFERHYH